MAFARHQRIEGGLHGLAVGVVVARQVLARQPVADATGGKLRKRTLAVRAVVIEVPVFNEVLRASEGDMARSASRSSAGSPCCNLAPFIRSMSCADFALSEVNPTGGRTVAAGSAPTASGVGCGWATSCDSSGALAREGVGVATAPATSVAEPASGGICVTTGVGEADGQRQPPLMPML